MILVLVSILLLLYLFDAILGVSFTSLRRESSVPRSALVSLVKQRDMDKIVTFVRNIEDRYNSRFRHDWVFLSEENFKPQFIKVISAFVSGRAYFRTIDRKLHWKVPEQIDVNKLKNDMMNLEMQGVPYGGSTSYRLMSRFQAGFFMHYLPEYRYYARIDPDVRFFCDVEEDIFATMHAESKKYGFAISLEEVPHTVHDLDKAVETFAKQNPSLVNPNSWVHEFVKPSESFCHFWSNFEVADLDFFRSEGYRKLFEHLESSGGFFYHRWGDAPVHSIAVALLLEPKDVHWFEHVGMYHKPNVNCPTSEDERLRRKCTCPHDISLALRDQNDIFTYRKQSCMPRFLNLIQASFQEDWKLWADSTVLREYASRK